MEITHHQFVFNTDNMTAFATGSPSIPTIYMNENGLAFLELSRKSWLAPRMRFLGRMEARRLALLYRLRGILEILDCSVPSSGKREVAAVGA